MPGPNKPVSQQLIREARIGLTIVALLAGLLCYVAWNRFSGNWDQVPDHVANAPIAQNMNREFREQHRQELAKLDLSPPVTSNSNLVANPRTQDTTNSNPIQQTFTQNRTTPDSESVTSQPKTPSPHLPISTNELRPANPHRNNSDVRTASFTEHGNPSPKNFDDPFGAPSQTHLSNPKTNQDFVPRKPFKLSDEEASEFKPNLNTNQEFIPNTTPQTNDQTPPNSDGSSFQRNPKQPSVVMQRTRFQVQVVEDPESIPSYEQQMAQKTNTVDTGSTSTEFNPGQREFESNAPPVKEHKPLTRAEDFATHSLHPPRPVKPTTNSQPPEVTPIQKTVTGLKEQYTVQTGQQTLWEVAQEVYGDGRLFRAVYEVNRSQIPNPDELLVGTSLTVPPLEELVQKFRAHVPEDLVPTTDTTPVHVTLGGDTLFDIARQRLGQASRFNELIELNRGRLPLDVSHLSPLSAGMRIELPRN